MQRLLSTEVPPGSLEDKIDSMVGRTHKRMVFFQLSLFVQDQPMFTKDVTRRTVLDTRSMTCRYKYNFSVCFCLSVSVSVCLVSFYHDLNPDPYAYDVL